MEIFQVFVTMFSKSSAADLLYGKGLMSGPGQYSPVIKTFLKAVSG